MTGLAGTTLGPETIQKYVLIGISAMLLASVTSAFWGGSVRGIREQDDRRYAEWHEKYLTVQLPLELELQRRNYGLVDNPDADSPPSIEVTPSE